MNTMVIPRMQHLASILLLAVSGTIGLAPSSLCATELVERWKLDEPGPPFAGMRPDSPTLVHDPATTLPVREPGYEGSSMRMFFSAVPGVGTRVSSVGDSLKSDSFGFSFWLKPVDMKPGDNVIAKEIPLVSGPDFARLGWQVFLGADNGSGMAPLGFVVRGADRNNGDFFGQAWSSVLLPVSRASGTWFHVAGGYDATTGKLVLTVNGVASAVIGRAGAVNSTSGTLSVGGVRNGEDMVASAAQASLDDLRIYRGILSAEEIEAQMATPDPSARLLAHWPLDESSPPYADASGRGIPLVLDAATTPPLSATGVDRNGVHMHFDAGIGLSTRLTADKGVMQSDSFGFSFWVRPIAINPGDNLLAQQADNPAAPLAERTAWQIRVGSDDGSGRAHLEFVVRGNQSAPGSFYGLAVSDMSVPLAANEGQWFHIAGGYDASTGRMALYINGAGSVVEGTPGAQSSMGGSLDVGTIRSEAGVIAYSASAAFDDLQIYGGLLSAHDVGRLMGRPGSVVLASQPPRARANLVAHWRLAESSPPYASSISGGPALEQDFSTTATAKVPGVNDDGLELRWTAEKGVSTRLFAQGNALQSDSFGFSFWIRPRNMAPFENILAKEAPPLGGEGFTRLAWQVQVGADDGAGMAPLQLVVRGTDRTQTNFFGTLLSSVLLPLHSEMNEWVHVAGGYDAETGALSLIVNGVEAWVQGRPGADNSDGSWLSLGTVRNGTDFVAYATSAEVDEVQMFDGPVSLYEEACLRKFPGRELAKHFEISSFTSQPEGAFALTFNSNDGWYYYIDASSDLVTYKPVSLVRGRGETTSYILTRSEIDAALGAEPRKKLFFRVRALLEDPLDLTLDLPPATILPFYNPAMYAPQYHFSFEHANVGDPNGVIRYGDTYHIFTWDHAASSNLLTWSPLGWPMRDTSADAGFWTGSVVVDLQNTSGFGVPGGLPPMVAIYTMHDPVTLQESVGIAYSTDHYNFYNYLGNPVVAVPGELTFRDPEVFWDVPRARWCMAVARSERQAIQFYSSPDLKNWTPTGLFNADFADNLEGNRATRVGARSEIWEVPGLVQVPVKGAGNQKKWLLFVGAGTDKVQYFVGNFDGTRFTMDSATWNYLRYGTGLEGDVFADFEQSHWNGWTPVGDAFGWEPVPFWWNRPAYGYLGDRLASSYGHNPDYAPGIQDFRTGKLMSPAFTVSRNSINFLIGGGNHPGKTCINLVVNGNIVRSTTGNNSDSLRWAGWDVAEFMGQPAHIEIVDDETGSWGRIYVDHIVFSDILMNTGKEHANWADYGSDFFAPKVVRDYDGVEADIKWIAWIGSWLYEQYRPQPANWGKGVETIFRKLQLAPSPKGYQLVQQPDQALQFLRGSVVNAAPRIITGVQTLTEFQPQTNTYEMEVTFDLATTTARRLGVNLCAQDEWPQRVVVGYDRISGNIYLDRTASGFVTFGPGFQNAVTAPYRPATSELKLRIFVDQSSIEVFTSDGIRVLTSQIYPHPAGRGVQVFSSEGSAALKGLRAWPMRSIW